MTAALMCLLLAAAPPPAPDAADRVLVLAFRAEGVEARLAEALERDVAEAAAAIDVDVISRQDVAALLDVEAARQAMTCTGESACLAEFAGGLGARRVITGVATLLGDDVEVALTLLDTHGATVLARTTARAPLRDRPALRAALSTSTGRLFGVEPPPPPGPHMGLLIGGGVAGAVGLVGALGFLPLAGALQATTDADTAADRYARSGSLADLDALFEVSARRDANIAAWNSWGVASVVGGAALVTGGVVAMSLAPVVGGAP
jgi:hypothetical protein